MTTASAPALAPATTSTSDLSAVDTPLYARRVYADQRACFWLSEANEALEAGKVKKAAECERKAGFWLDRLNKLEGLHDVGTPIVTDLTQEDQQSIDDYVARSEQHYNDDPVDDDPYSDDYVDEDYALGNALDLVFAAAADGVLVSEDMDAVADDHRYFLIAVLTGESRGNHLTADQVTDYLSSRYSPELWRVERDGTPIWQMPGDQWLDWYAREVA